MEETIQPLRQLLDLKHMYACKASENKQGDCPTHPGVQSISPLFKHDTLREADKATGAELFRKTMPNLFVEGTMFINASELEV